MTLWEWRLSSANRAITWESVGSIDVLGTYGYQNADIRLHDQNGLGLHDMKKRAGRALCICGLVMLCIAMVSCGEKTLESSDVEGHWTFKDARLSRVDNVSKDPVVSLDLNKDGSFTVSGLIGDSSATNLSEVGEKSGSGTWGLYNFDDRQQVMLKYSNNLPGDTLIVEQDSGSIYLKNWIGDPDLHQWVKLVRRDVAP